ncbi:MAG: 3-isopropylmalate dehydratase large subunit [Dehalococcoidales bacterium]|nr:3-isopropylmalate dehydratase large subunit [Dehalococcoidales bacterium]
MPQTITEKILAAHAGKDTVRPGEIVIVKVDLVLVNDITGLIADREFRKMGVTKVWNPDKIAIVLDHFVPAKDMASAEQSRISRRFAQEFGVTHFYDVGRAGIEHALLPEQGLVLPGELIIGADSHTVTYGGIGAFSTGVGGTDAAAAMALGETWLRVPETIKFVYRGRLGRWITGKDLVLYTIGQIGVEGARYKAMEFTGEAIGELSVEGRLTMCNMAIEAGGKSGIVPPDDKTVAYVKERAKRPFTVYQSDEDAQYEKVYEWDVGGLEPQVALPHLPANSVPVSKVGEIRIDQAVIGSCTNGRIEDLRLAATVLKGQKVDPNVRLIVIPATQDVYRQAMHEGLFDIFIEAGGTVSAPTCGPCLGGYMGILAAGERCVSTTNRNFVGRMGDRTSEVYLASPAVAAASAIAGKIAGPEEVL